MLEPLLSKVGLRFCSLAELITIFSRGRVDVWSIKQLQGMVDSFSHGFCSVEAGSLDVLSIHF